MDANGTMDGPSVGYVFRYAAADSAMRSLGTIGDAAPLRGDRRLGIVEVRAQWTHSVSQRVDASARAAGAEALHYDNTLLALAPGFGLAAPGAPSHAGPVLQHQAFAIGQDHSLPDRDGSPPAIGAFATFRPDQVRGRGGQGLSTDRPAGAPPTQPPLTPSPIGQLTPVPATPQ